MQRAFTEWCPALPALGFDTFAGKTPVVLVRMPDQATAFEFASRCRKKGVVAMAVIFPAVPQNVPRIRATLTAALSEEDIALALELIERHCGLLA